MNYKRIYFELIKKRIKCPARNQFTYTENHHIKPVSIFPEDKTNKRNIVNLSAREHFIAHALLVKYYKQNGQKKNYYKMLRAFDAMSNLGGSHRISELTQKYNKGKSYLYSIWKEELLRYIKESGCRAGKNSPNYNKILIHNEELKQQKYIQKDVEIPIGWSIGLGSWLIKSRKNSSTHGRIWIYNKETNEQLLIKPEEINKYIFENSLWIKGIPPNSKIRIQQFNPLTNNIWITNLELKEFKLWPKNKEIPDGWLQGKIVDFDLYLSRYEDAKTGAKDFYFSHYEKDIKNKQIPKIRKRQYSKSIKLSADIEKKILEARYKELREYYKVYCEYGYAGVVKLFNYQYTKQNLVAAFKKYLPEFIPQNGKRRLKHLLD